MLKREYKFDWDDKYLYAKWERGSEYKIFEIKDEDCEADLEVYVDWEFELLTQSAWEATSFCYWYEAAMLAEVPNRISLL